jgi:hypothetical protein
MCALSQHTEDAQVQRRPRPRHGSGPQVALPPVQPCVARMDHTVMAATGRVLSRGSRTRGRLKYAGLQGFSSVYRKADMSAKPKPKVVSEICSLCGLDWKLHGKEPTTETCIGLLAAEVRRLEAALAVRPLTYPVPYPAPYPVPYYPRPYPVSPWRWGTSNLPSITYTGTTHTPAVSGTSPQAMLSEGATA